MQFAPNGSMGVTYKNKSGISGYKNLTPDEYIATSGKYIFERGFFEKEIKREVEIFGSLVHVWSTYEGRTNESDIQPLMHGVNSIQLVKVGNEYKITSLIWQQESPELPLPLEYLPGKK